MVADWPVSGERIDTGIHSDVDEDIFQSEKENLEPWSGVRTVNQLVVRLGEDLGVKTYIVAPPLICIFCCPKLPLFKQGLTTTRRFGNWFICHWIRANSYGCRIVSQEQASSNAWNRLWCEWLEFVSNPVVVLTIYTDMEYRPSERSQQPLLPFSPGYD